MQNGILHPQVAGTVGKTSSPVLERELGPLSLVSWCWDGEGYRMVPTPLKECWENRQQEERK